MQIVSSALTDQTYGPTDLYTRKEIYNYLLRNFICYQPPLRTSNSGTCAREDREISRKHLLGENLNRMENSGEK